MKNLKGDELFKFKKEMGFFNEIPKQYQPNQKF